MYMQTRGFVTEEILRMEVEEGLERLNEALKVGKVYQDCFFQHKEKLQSYHVADKPPVPDWNFDPVLVFARLQRFLQLLHTLKVYTYVIPCMHMFVHA